MAGKSQPKTTQADIDATTAAFKELTRKPKRFTARAVVEQLLPQIEHALQQGYSLDEILEIMARHNTVMAASTLKQYLSELRSSAKKATRSSAADNSTSDQ